MRSLKFLDINLSNEQSRQDWNLHMLKKVFMILGMISIFVILLFSGALFFYKVYLQKSLPPGKRTNTDIDNVNQDFGEDEILKQIGQLNHKINYFYDILSTQEEIFGILNGIVNNIPDSVNIYTIDFSRKDNIPVLSLKGISRDRAGFIEFESYIKSDSNFFNIQSPPSNLTKKENIEFLISMSIKDLKPNE